MPNLETIICNVEQPVEGSMECGTHCRRQHGFPLRIRSTRKHDPCKLQGFSKKKKLCLRTQLIDSFKMEIHEEPSRLVRSTVRLKSDECAPKGHIRQHHLVPTWVDFDIHRE